MTSSPRRFVTLYAWIAIFAILLNALAPSITAAKAYVSGKPMAIMGVGLMRHHMMPADAADQPDGKRAVASAETCPFCGIHAGSFGLPVPPPLPPLSVAVTAFSSSAWFDVLLPAAPWPVYQSRAPPLSLSAT